MHAQFGSGAVRRGGMLCNHADAFFDTLVITVFKEADVPADVCALRNDIVCTARVQLAGAHHAGIKRIMILRGNLRDAQRNIARGLDGIYRLIGTRAVPADAVHLDIIHHGASHQRAVRQVKRARFAAAVQMGADGAVHPAARFEPRDDLVGAAADLLCHLKAEIQNAAQRFPLL